MGIDTSDFLRINENANIALYCKPNVTRS